MNLSRANANLFLANLQIFCKKNSEMLCVFTLLVLLINYIDAMEPRRELPSSKSDSLNLSSKPVPGEVSIKGKFSGTTLMLYCISPLAYLILLCMYICLFLFYVYTYVLHIFSIDTSLE